MNLTTENEKIVSAVIIYCFNIFLEKTKLNSIQKIKIIVKATNNKKIRKLVRGFLS